MIIIMHKIICILLPFHLPAAHAYAGSLRRLSMESSSSPMKMMGFGECSSESQCNICEGGCAQDSDCKDDLVCKNMGLCEKYIACHYEEEHQSNPWCSDGNANVESEWTDRLSNIFSFSRGYCVESSSDEASTLDSTTDVGNESSENDTDTNQDADFKLSEEQAASSPTVETETAIDEDSEEESGEETPEVVDVEPAETQASYSPTLQPTFAATSSFGNVVTNLLSKSDSGREEYSVGTISMITIGVVATICVILLFVSKKRSKQKGRSNKEILPMSNSNAQIFATTLGGDEDPTSSVDEEVLKGCADESEKSGQKTASLEAECGKNRCLKSTSSRSQQIVENMPAQEADNIEASIKSGYARSYQRSKRVMSWIPGKSTKSVRDIIVDVPRSRTCGHVSEEGIRSLHENDDAAGNEASIEIEYVRSNEHNERSMSRVLEINVIHTKDCVVDVETINGWVDTQN